VILALAHNYGSPRTYQPPECSIRFRPFHRMNHAAAPES